MNVREPAVEIHGPMAIHDQRCAVYHGKHAVLEMGTGIFHPSWTAQEDGWRLVKTNWAQRAVMRWIGLAGDK